MNSTVEVNNEFSLIVDYAKTIWQAIADGDYHRVDSSITPKNFPISPEMIGKRVEVSAKLFHFNRSIDSEDAISEMDKAGYRPATLMELLALGHLFPELQRQFPIVAFGSVWGYEDKNASVPFLFTSAGRRELFLDRYYLDWYTPARFLGVRE